MSIGRAADTSATKRLVVSSTSRWMRSRAFGSSGSSGLPRIFPAGLPTWVTFSPAISFALDRSTCQVRHPTLPRSAEAEANSPPSEAAAAQSA